MKTKKTPPPPQTPPPPTKPRAKSRAPSPAAQLRERVKQVRTILDSKKGEHIAILNVAKVSSVTDYMILCSGLNHPHIRALADEVVKQLRLAKPPVAPHRRAGSAESEWIVLDYVDFIVHIFTPGMREYYAMEQLWKDAATVK